MDSKIEKKRRENDEKCCQIEKNLARMANREFGNLLEFSRESPEKSVELSSR